VAHNNQRRTAVGSYRGYNNITSERHRSCSITCSGSTSHIRTPPMLVPSSDGRCNCCFGTHHLTTERTLETRFLQTLRSRHTCCLACCGTASCACRGRGSASVAVVSSRRRADFAGTGSVVGSARIDGHTRTADGSRRCLLPHNAVRRLYRTICKQKDRRRDRMGL